LNYRSPDEIYSRDEKILPTRSYFSLENLSLATRLSGFIKRFERPDFSTDFSTAAAFDSAQFLKYFLLDLRLGGAYNPHPRRVAHGRRDQRGERQTVR
jgi:hypothetical protein